MKKQAYLLRSLQKRLGTRVYLCLLATGAGSVRKTFDDDIVFTFGDEDEFYEKVKEELKNN